MAAEKTQRDKSEKAGRKIPGGGGDSENRRRREERREMEREADHSRTAAQFKALGDPTRLRIIDLLLAHEACLLLSGAANKSLTDGLTVGAVSVGIGGSKKVSSSLSHHLKDLRQTGLITMKRQGKNLHCRIDGEAMTYLRGRLQSSGDDRASFNDDDRNEEYEYDDNDEADNGDREPSGGDSGDTDGPAGAPSV